MVSTSIVGKKEKTRGGSGIISTDMKAALLTTLAFICSFVLIIPPDWHVGDDSTIAMVLNGLGWTDEPSEYVPFINIYLCKIIKWFSEHWPQWFWYSFFIFALTAISLFQILLMVFDQKRPTSFLVTVLGLVFFVYFPLFVSISFTKTAIFLGVSSLFILLHLQNQQDSSHTKFKEIFGVLGFVLASLLRFNGAMLALTLCAPWLVYSLIKKPSVTKKLSLAISLGCLAALTGIFQFLHFKSYAQIPDWANYMSSAKILSYFMDYYRDFTSSEMIEKLATVGIDNLDVKLIRHWLISEDILSDSKLLKLKDLIPPPKMTLFEGAWAVLRWNFLKQATLILLSVSLGMFFVCKKRRECLLMWSGAFVVAVYLKVYMKLPARLFEPLLGTMLLSPLVFWSSPPIQWMNRKWVTGLLFVIMLKVNVSEARYVRYLARELYQTKTTYLQDLFQLNQATKDIIYWIYNDFTELPVFRSPKPHLKSFRLLGFGWFGRTGLQKERMRELGVDSVFKGLLDGRNAVVVATPEVHPLLQEVFKRKYDEVGVEFEPVFNGAYLKAFRVVKSRF